MPDHHDRLALRGQQALPRGHRAGETQRQRAKEGEGEREKEKTLCRLHMLQVSFDNPRQAEKEKGLERRGET